MIGTLASTDQWRSRRGGPLAKKKKKKKETKNKNNKKENDRKTDIKRGRESELRGSDIQCQHLCFSHLITKF